MIHAHLTAPLQFVEASPAPAGAGSSYSSDTARTARKCMSLLGLLSC
jgi:hypothetical protein